MNPNTIQKAREFLIVAITRNNVEQLERILNANYPVNEPIQAYGKITPLMFCA